jgi:hypothetical protein
MVKNFIRILKHRKMTNCVIFFALKCQFTALDRFEFQPRRASPRRLLAAMAYEDGSDRSARENMCLANLFSGMAL